MYHYIFRASLVLDLLLDLFKAFLVWGLLVRGRVRQHVCVWGGGMFDVNQLTHPGDSHVFQPRVVFSVIQSVPL